MKKRSFIPIASLVVLSGAAAVSGTFAWFQTNRSLSLTFDDATIRSRDSHLVVDYIGSKNTMTESDITSEFGDIKLKLESEDQFVTDISGNGVNFYKLDQGYRINDNEDKIDGVSWQVPLKIDTIDLSDAKSADGYLIDFTIELSQEKLTENFSDNLEVYIGSGTKIEPVTAVDGDADQRAKDLKAVAGARLAISEVGVGGVLTPKKLMTQVEEEDEVDRIVGYDKDGDPVLSDNKFDNSDPLYMYLVEDAAGEAYQVSGHKLVDATGNDGDFEEVIVLGELDDTTDRKTSLQTDPTFLVELGANAVQFNFRMWIEGTDADVGFSDDNVAVGGKIKLTLDLYTLHAGRNV